MKNDKVVQAFSQLEPDEAARARMLQNVLGRKKRRGAPRTANTQRTRDRLARFAGIAAALAIIAGGVFLTRSMWLPGIAPEVGPGAGSPPAASPTDEPGLLVPTPPPDNNSEVITPDPTLPELYPTPEPLPDPVLPSVSITATQFAHPPDVERIEVIWRNISDVEAGFGEEFQLEKLADHEWVAVPSDMAFTDPLHLIPPNAEVPHTYHIRAYTGGRNLEPGMYRIVVDFVVHIDQPGNEHVPQQVGPVFAEFSVFSVEEPSDEVPDEGVVPPVLPDRASRGQLRTTTPPPPPVPN